MRNHLGLALPPMPKDIRDSAMSIIRTYNATMWLPGISEREGNYVDSIGAIPRAISNDVVGFVDDVASKDVAENAVTNSDMVGAAVPSTVPTGWNVTAPVAGYTREIVALGVDPVDSLPYLDFRIYGTPTASTSDMLEPFTNWTKVSALIGDIVTTSCYITLIAGTLPANIVFGINERNSGAGVAGTQVVTLNTLLTLGVEQRIVVTRKMLQATCDHATIQIRGSSLNTSTYSDFTLRIKGLQLNKGREQPLIRTAGLTSGDGILRPSHSVAYQETTGFKPQLRGGYLNWARSSKNASVAGSTRWDVGVGSSIVEYITVPKLGIVARVAATTGVSQHSFRFSSVAVLPNSIVHRFCVHVRAAGNDRTVMLQVRNCANAFLGSMLVNLDSGAFPAGIGSFTSPRVTKVENGFFRIEAEFDSGVGATLPQVIVYFYSGTSKAGDPGDMLDIGGGILGLPQDFPDIIPEVGDVSTPAYSNEPPFSFFFDGVDDRLVMSKMTIDPAANHVFMVAGRVPASITSAYMLLGHGDASAATRMQVGFFSTFVPRVFWRDAASVTVDPTAFSGARAPGELLVATGMKNGTTYTGRIKSNLTAAYSNSAIATLAAWTPTLGHVGAGVSSGLNAFPWPGEIFGVIEIAGTPTVDEITILENFLAGCAGFTPLP